MLFLVLILWAQFTSLGSSEKYNRVAHPGPQRCASQEGIQALIMQKMGACVPSLRWVLQDAEDGSNREFHPGIFPTRKGRILVKRAVQVYI